MRHLLLPALCVALASYAHALIDTDLDGLSDIWENQHAFIIGENPPVSEAPGSDPDGDGFTNLAESRAGTDPDDQGCHPAHAFSFIPPVYEAAPPGGIPPASTPPPEDPFDPSPPPAPGAPLVLIDPPVSILTWPTVPGKTYEAIPSEDLADWSAATGAYIGDGTPHTFESETLYPDGVVPPKLFWRVEINDTDSDLDGLTDYEELHITDPANPTKTLDPLVSDTDGDGIPDGAEYIPGTNGLAAFTNFLTGDPDGAQGLAASLATGLIARWDLEGTFIAPSQGPYYTLARYGDSVGTNHIVPFHSETKPEGMPSKGAGTTSVGVGFLCPPRSLLHNRSVYSVSLWARIEQGSISATRPLAALFTHHRRLTKPVPYQSQYNIDINGMWIERLANGTQVLRAGTSNFINYVPGTNQQVNGTWAFNGVTSPAMPPGTYDDGKYHHYLIVRSSGIITVYRDGALIGTNPNVILAAINATNDTATGISLGRYYGEPAESGLPVNDLLAAKATFDRIRVWNRTLTAVEAESLYRQDADGDGLWDITEERTRKWDDHNLNAIVESGEFAFVANPLHADPADSDHDTDEISSIREQDETLTDIAKADTDGDGLPDGFEDRYRPTLNPLVVNDGALDPEGDGLTTAQEYAGGTNPTVSDAHLYPPTWISVERSLRYDFDDYGLAYPTAPKKLTTTATWPGAVPTNEDPLVDMIPFADLGGTLALRQPFPGTFPPDKLSPDLSAGGEATTVPTPPCHHASLTHRSIIVKTATATPEPREFDAILINERTIDGIELPVEAEMLTLTVPPNSTQSQPYDLTPTFNDGGTGNGAYSETVKHSILPTEIDFVMPDSEDWSEIMPENRVVMRDEKTKIRIRIKGISLFANQMETTGLEGLHLKTNFTRAGFPDVLIPFNNRLCQVLPGKNQTEIRCEFSRNDLRSLGLLPRADGIDLTNYSTLDYVSGEPSNFEDSQAFIDSMVDGLRGAPAGYSNNKPNVNLGSSPPQSAPHRTFMQAAGSEILTARLGPMKKLGLIMNQGEVFYFSGHGLPGRRETGGAAFPIDGGEIINASQLKEYWNEDLHLAIISGCSAVNINNWNPDSGTYLPPLTGPSAGYYPGESMNTTGPRFILGYGSSAPTDAQNSDLIASSFVGFYIQNPADPFSAWRQANDNSNGRNATAIEQNSRFGHFEAITVAGLPVDYIWKVKPQTDW